MMQATDFGNLHDPARLGELNGPDVRRIRVEREMSASPVKVREVAGQDAAEVPFAENENVIQTLAPDRAGRAAPRRGSATGCEARREHFVDSHAVHALPEHVTVDRVAIAEEIGGCGVVREGVDELLGGPGGGGMLGDAEVDDPSTMVSGTTRTKSTRKLAVGMVKKSRETRSRA